MICCCVRRKKPDNCREGSGKLTITILHVAPAYYPATYWGGPTFSTYNLCNSLVKQPGIVIDVLATDTAGPALNDRVRVTGSPMRYAEGYDVFFAPKRVGIDIAPSLLPRLWRRARKSDLIHITGTYSFTTLPALIVARLLDKPVVWSPRGAIQATDEWSGAGNRAVKQAFHKVARLLAPKRLLIHATSEDEAAACRRQLPDLEAFVSPNGVDCPELLPSRLPIGLGDPVRLVFLSRLHKKKGLNILLEALKALPPRFTLDVYGTGEASYVTRLEEMIGELGLKCRVTLHGHVDGKAKQAALFSGDIFVLPSHSENFGIAIAEALAHGLPVVVSNKTPWKDVQTRGCGAWIENDPDSFREGILGVASNDIRAMGRLGHEWMKTSFGWEALGSQMVDAYRKLIVDLP